jgi:hypothetical protein
MGLAEDPFSHTYGGSSEFNAAAFLTSFDRKSFGRRIVAKINNNLNKPTISADRSLAYLNFGTSHKHRFLYDTSASVFKRIFFGEDVGDTEFFLWSNYCSDTQ